MIFPFIRFLELLLGVTGAGGRLCIDNLSSCGDHSTDHTNQTAQRFNGMFLITSKGTCSTPSGCPSPWLAAQL